MTAQQSWKSEYNRFKNELKIRWACTAFEIINNARRYVRESALERKLTAAQRRIAELSAEISRMHEEGAAIEEYVYPAAKHLPDGDARLLEQWHERM